MDWKEIQENTRALTEMAAQKLNEASDLAALHLRLKTAEYRRRALYEEFGKVAYKHFTTDDNGAEAIAKYVEAITLLNREIAGLKKAIRTMQEKKELP